MNVSPADGWFMLNKHGAAGSFAAFDNISAGKLTWITSLAAESDCRVSCPAKKGDSVILYYAAKGATNGFRFIYAVGSEPSS